jgi:hypothetical protein
MDTIPLKKITTDLVMGYGAKLAEGQKFKLSVPDKHTLLFYVMGAVADAILKPTKFNAKQQMLVGRFEAVRINDRQTFSSANLYLPDNNYQEGLAQSVLKGRENGEIVEPEFAFMIGYQAGPSPTGYVWTQEPMTDTRVQDRLSSVRKLVNDSKLLERFNLPALEAPKVSSIKK